MKIRYILLALALVGVIALVSCDNGGETSSEPSESSTGLIDAGVKSDESGQWGPIVGLDQSE